MKKLQCCWHFKSELWIWMPLPLTSSKHGQTKVFIKQLYLHKCWLYVLYLLQNDHLVPSATFGFQVVLIPDIFKHFPHKLVVLTSQLTKNGDALLWTIIGAYWHRIVHIRSQISDGGWGWVCIKGEISAWFIYEKQILRWSEKALGLNCLHYPSV